MNPVGHSNKSWIGLGVRIAILLLWLTLLAVLFFRQRGLDHMPASFSAAGLEETNPEEVHVNFNTDEIWMGVYYHGEKIGYTNQYAEIREDGAQFIYRNSLLRVQTMGSRQTIHSKSKVTLNAQNDFDSFQAELNTQSKVQNLRFQITGKKQGNSLEIKVHTGGEIFSETIPLDSPLFLSENIRLKLAERWRELREGQEFAWPFFDPFTRNQADIRIRVLAKENLTLQDQSIPTLKLAENFQGLLTTVWMDQKGRTLKEISPSGFEMKMEKKAQALAFSDSSLQPVDILALSLIRADHPQLQSGKNHFLKVRLKGISIENFSFKDHRQNLTGDILEIQIENLQRISPLALPIEDPGLEEYLRPSVLVQSGDQRIQSMAKKVIGRETNSLKAAQKLYEWVDRFVIDDFSASIPSALEVMQNPHGDCNEHTVLYVALARAIGLPARTNVGLVFLNSDRLGKGFFYHAWPEVYVGQWLALDPTLRQFPADASHIRFVQGELEKQMPMLAVIGQLALEIREVL